MLFMCGPIRHYWFLVAVGVIKQFKLHVYCKRQTSDSSSVFLKIENDQIKTAQNNSLIWIKNCVKLLILV